MIDKAFASLKQLKAHEDDASYSPEKAVAGIYFRPLENSGVITVVFGPWHAPKSFYNLLTRQLRKQGSGILAYDFNPNILSLNPETVRLSFENIANQVGQDVNRKVFENSLEKVDLLGFSIGNVALSMTLEKLDRFDSVTMVVPGSELAQPFWTGARTSRMSEAYKSDGATLETIQAEWEKLAPAAHLDALVGHDVTVCLAKHDEFIPYESGLSLVRGMEQAGINPNVATTNAGHLVTVAKFCLSI